MNKNLIPAGAGLPSGDGGEEALLRAQARLWALLEKQTKRYTMGESTSVPVEVAQELLESICFALEVDPEGGPEQLKSLAEGDLDQRLAAGLEKIQGKIKAGKRLWRAVCLGMPQIENISLHDTVKSIGGFWRRYNYRLLAHEIPCDIDYQLCRPVEEKLAGVDYVNEYLRRLLIENDLLVRLDPARCAGVLKSYCPDYRGLLINLYEPIATNAIGLALVGGEVAALDIAPAQRDKIAATLAPVAGADAVAALQKAASAACDALGIGQPQARLYMRRLAAEMHPRVAAALAAGSLERIFLTAVR